MSELAPVSQVGIAIYNVPFGVKNVPVLCIFNMYMFMYLLLGLGTDGIFVFVNSPAGYEKLSSWLGAYPARIRKGAGGGCHAGVADKRKVEDSA